MECESERPEQEEHEWQMNEQLEECKANDVARAQAEHAQQRVEMLTKKCEIWSETESPAPFFACVSIAAIAP